MSASDDPGLGLTVGVWGTFDVENLGDVLFPRVFAAELGRRLPRARTIAYSPFGAERAMAIGAGWPIRPLGAPTPARRYQLAQEVDLVAIGGGDIAHVRDDLLGTAYGIGEDGLDDRRASDFFLDGLGPEHERQTPVVWNAVGVPFDFDEPTAARVRAALQRRPYVSVRDERSRARLERAGVEREVAVVPDTALLLPRVLSGAALERAAEVLRVSGWYPADGAPLVLQGSLGLVDQAGAVAAALDAVRAPGQTVVLMETGPCLADGAFADAVAPLLRAPVLRIPAATPADQLVAAIASPAGVVGSSLHANLLALAYGRPGLMLNFDGRDKLDGVASEIGRPETVARTTAELPMRMRLALSGPPSAGAMPALVARLDAHFDRIAELAERARWARAGAGDPDGAVRTRLGVLETEIERIASASAAAAGRHADEADALRARIADLEGQVSSAYEAGTQLYEAGTQLDGALTATRQALDAAEAGVRDLTQKLSEREAVLHRTVGALNASRAQADRLSDEAVRLRAALMLKEQELAAQAAERARAESALAQVLGSPTWKATAPMRMALRKVRPHDG